MAEVDSRGSGITLERVKDPLELLFLRCHADELVPLAELVGVTHAGVGLGQLARSIARAARRLARHGLLNAFLRRGEGPEWTEILAELSGQPVVGYDDVAETEVQVVRDATAAEWALLTTEQRREIWNSLGEVGDPPAAGAEAMTLAESKLGRGFGYFLTQSQTKLFAPRRIPLLAAFAVSPLGCCLRPCLLVLIVLTVMWSLRADQRRVRAVVLHVARLRQVVLRRITVGFVGSPSTGKDAGIKALFGIDTGNISPVAGSTRSVSIQRVPGATALYVVNTPGLGDVVQAVTDEAKQILGHIDVYLYVVNTQGGVQARELSDYRACVQSGRPVLALVNKIDTLRPADRDVYLADARGKLGAAPENFLPVAFDPLPQLSPTPIGIEAVRAWLVRALEGLGKDSTELPPLPTPAPPDEIPKDDPADPASRL